MYSDCFSSFVFGLLAEIYYIELVLPKKSINIDNLIPNRVIIDIDRLF